MNRFPDKHSIADASKRIAPYIHRTPVMKSSIINDMIGGEVFFKCENFQKVGAFKSRGACNAVFSLSESEIKQGVCTHSSGNHAAALARAAQVRGVPAFIVMPDNSSRVKIDAVRHYGAQITFCKNILSSREETLKQVSEKTGAVEIHPYNDYRIINGQATATLELIQDCTDLDIIMAPVGGGGLLSGTALATRFYSPGTSVIAAEPMGADDAYRSFKQKKFIPSIHPNTIADGLLTSLGTLTFPIIIDYVDDILIVSEDAIVRAMQLIWERMKIIVEPSSAVPLAAILSNIELFKNKRTGIIISGGNVDLTSLPWNKS